MHMIKLIFCAYALDMFFGDPKWMLHPVTVIARLAKKLERLLYRDHYLSGFLFTLTVVGGTGLSVWGMLIGAKALHPYLYDALAIYLMYTALATRDLAAHAAEVWQNLKEENLVEARNSVSMIVGRDTHQMGKAEIARATVESVGENMVDGVTAPLMFMLAFGPVGVWIFKAASTMDSLVGYKNVRYQKFGYASAKLDDLLTYLPARLTLLPAMLAALFFKVNPLTVLRLALRDGRKHESPNSAYGESYLSSLINKRLGGEARYQGEVELRPLIGEGEPVSTPDDILLAVKAMVVTSVFTLVLGLILLMIFKGGFYV